MRVRRMFFTLTAAIAVLVLAFPASNVVEAGTTHARVHSFTYTVELGDTLATISRKFGVSPDRILDLNGLRTRPDLIFVGEKLILPIDLGFTPSYVNPFLYVVQTGDTVQTLNNKFYIDRFSLRQVNKLPENANVLTPGATVLIPAGPRRYVVQRADSLQSIAALFHTPANTILRFNAHLGDGSRLFPGQNVYIPILYNAPFIPIAGAAVLAPVMAEGGDSGGGGFFPATTLNPATGLRPGDSAEAARAANAHVVSAFQTISLPQNVVNLDHRLEIRWNQLRRVRRDPGRDNGAIMTVAIQFRGGNGTVSVQHFVDGTALIRGLPVTGIYVNPGDKELWNDIEVDIPATCESVTTDQLIITSGGTRIEAHIEYKVVCP